MSEPAAAQTAPSADVQTPELPPDAWGAIARTALAAEGDSVQTWARLSLVARAWRDGLKGARSRHDPSCGVGLPLLTHWTLDSRAQKGRDALRPCAPAIADARASRVACT